MADLSNISDEELMRIAGVGQKDYSGISNEELFRSAGIEPTEKNLGLNTLGKKVLPTFISGAEPLPGERTVLGNILERPAAAVREGIRGGLKSGIPGAIEGYIKGSNLPEQSKTFTKQSQESPLNTVIPFTGKNKVVDSLSLVERFTKGFVRDLAGFTADTVTNPVDLGLTVFGGSPAKKVATINPKEISNVSKLFDKAVRPSVALRRSSTELKNANKNLQTALETIVENKDRLNYIDDAGEIIKGKSPQNLNEFSQAIDSTKKDVFKAYTKMKEIAGQEKRVIFVDDIAQEIRKAVDTTAIKDFAPKVAEKANNLAMRLDKRGFYSVDEANDVLESLNQQLKAFYRNPDPKTTHTNQVNALVANRLREKLDNVINQENLQGVGEETIKAFGNLKRRYGALKSIERDVNRRLVVDARKNMKGLIDFTDIYTAQQLTEGILSNNPIKTVKGGLGFITKEAIKKINDPNRQVAEMFNRVEKLKSGVEPAGRQLLRVAPLAVRTVDRAIENVQPSNRLLRSSR